MQAKFGLGFRVWGLGFGVVKVLQAPILVPGFSGLGFHRREDSHGQLAGPYLNQRLPYHLIKEYS